MQDMKDLLVFLPGLKRLELTGWSNTNLIRDPFSQSMTLLLSQRYSLIPQTNRIWPTAVAGEADTELTLPASALQLWPTPHRWGKFC